MMGKTHLAVGLATSLAVVQPKSFDECLMAIIGGAVGGVLADCDIIDNDYKSDAVSAQLLASGIAAAAFIVGYVFNLGFSQAVIDQGIRSVIGSMGFILLYFVGVCSSHRTFTHSLTALALYTVAVYFICAPLAVGFFAAYLSHIALDIMNRRKVQIFYPFDFGVCFKWCYANKTADKVFMKIGFGAVGDSAVGWDCCELHDIAI